MSNVEKALKVREGINVNKALKAYKKRKEANAQSSYEDIVTDSIRKLIKPTPIPCLIRGERVL